MADAAAQALRTIDRHQMIQKGDTVIVACSGGADSVALFHFLFSQIKPLGIHLRAAHVNHALRGAESDADAAFVEALCQQCAVPLDVKTLSLPPKCSENEARIARYEFFEQLSQTYSAKIATAHTRSDQAETVLLHLSRGAGVHGAAGIPYVRGVFIRPFLEVSRADVEQYLAQNALVHITDSSNSEMCYARNRVRHVVLPALAGVNPSVEGALSRFAGNLAEVAQYLDSAADTLLLGAKTNICGEEAYRTQVLAAAAAPVRKAALRLLCLPYADPTAALLGELDHLLTQNGAVQLSKTALLRSAQGVIRLIQAGPSASFTWQIPFTGENISLPHGEMLILAVQSHTICEDFINFSKEKEKRLNFVADYDMINKRTFFRTRRSGDKFAPMGRGVIKTLKKFFSEQKLSAAQRESTLVLADGNEILWVQNFGFSEKLRPGKDTQKTVEFFTKAEE